MGANCVYPIKQKEQYGLVVKN